MAIATATSIEDMNQKIAEAKDKLMVIMFTSPSCSACRVIDPKVSQLAQEFGHRASFIKVDVNQSTSLTDKYSVKLLPTFLFMRFGKNLNQFSGADAPKLTRMINEYIMK